MQAIFQRTQGLIGLLLATLLLFTSIAIIAPAPARADDCYGSICPTLKMEGQGVAFTAGFVFGVWASGGTVPAAVGAVAAAAGGIVASPVIVPVAVGTATVGGAVVLWHHFSHH